MGRRRDLAAHAPGVFARRVSAANGVAARRAGDVRRQGRYPRSKSQPRTHDRSYCTLNPNEP